MYAWILVLVSLVTAADKKKKTTYEPPPPQYSQFTSVYTSVTYIPMNPNYDPPYQPYPDTQGVNMGGLGTSTVTNTVYIEASPVTYTVTESRYFTQYITVEAPIQQCAATVSVPVPPLRGSGDPMPAATQILPNPPAQPNVGQYPTQSQMTLSTDTLGSSDEDTSDATTTSSKKKSHHATTSSSSSIYVPQFVSSSSRRRGLFG